MMSQATPSSRILTACGAGTLRARSLIRSRALSMAAGSNVFRVVLTVMEPSTKSRVQAMPNFSSDRVINGHASRRYISRYLGKRVANEDSSAKVPPTLSSGLNASICERSISVCMAAFSYTILTFHLSISSVSHGFSELCVEGMVKLWWGVQAEVQNGIYFPQDFREARRSFGSSCNSSTGSSRLA